LSYTSLIFLAFSFTDESAYKMDRCYEYKTVPSIKNNKHHNKETFFIMKYLPWQMYNSTLVENLSAQKKNTTCQRAKYDLDIREYIFLFPYRNTANILLSTKPLHSSILPLRFRKIFVVLRQQSHLPFFSTSPTPFFTSYLTIYDTKGLTLCVILSLLG